MMQLDYLYYGLPKSFTQKRIDIMEKLVEVLYHSNSGNVLCGMGENQVYGPVYNALRNLLIECIGEVATNAAMNCSTWCVSSFEYQIVPAILEGLQVAEEENKYNFFKSVQKIVFEKHDYSQEEYCIYLNDKNDVIIVARNGVDKVVIESGDYNALMEWLGY